jgi:transposase-like protein
LDGKKDVPGIRLGAAESAKYWLNVLTGLKNRGVQDILIASVDGLSGFVDAIHAAFPQTEVQRCVIHQIRASTRCVSCKDVKAFSADLKPIYKAAAEESALAALDDLAAKWGATYALGVKSWRVNWTELSTMFKYPPEIRTLIYTTNAIENFNRQLRKVTKTKSAFVSDDALLKILYLATMNITDKWTMPIRNWGTILDHLMIYFGDRVPITL